MILHLRLLSASLLVLFFLPYPLPAAGGLDPFIKYSTLRQQFDANLPPGADKALLEQRLRVWLDTGDPEFERGMRMILLEDVYAPELATAAARIVIDGKGDDWDAIPPTATFPPQKGVPPYSELKEWKHRFEDNGDLSVMFRTTGRQDGPTVPGFRPNRLFQVWVWSPEIPFGTFRLQTSQTGKIEMKYYHHRTLPDGAWDATPRGPEAIVSASLGEVAEVRFPLGRYLEQTFGKRPTRFILRPETRYYLDPWKECFNTVAAAVTVETGRRNNALGLLLGLLARGEYDPGDSMAFAFALANNWLYTAGDDGVKAAVLRDMTGHRALYKKTLAWQKALPLALDLSRMPLDAKLRWAWRAYAATDQPLTLAQYREYIDSIETLETFHRIVRTNGLSGVQSFAGLVSSLRGWFASHMRRASGDPALYIDDGFGRKHYECVWPNAQLRVLRARGYMQGNCMTETTVLSALLRGAGIPASEFHRSKYAPDQAAHNFATWYDPFCRLWRMADWAVGLPPKLDIMALHFHRLRWHHRLPHSWPWQNAPAATVLGLITRGMDEAHFTELSSHRTMSTNRIFDSRFVLVGGPDTDGDGIADDIERRLGTDPGKADSDGDGSADLWEIEHGFDPRNPASRPAAATHPVIDGLSAAVPAGGRTLPIPPLDRSGYSYVYDIKSLTATRSGGGLYLHAGFHAPVRTFPWKLHVFLVEVCGRTNDLWEVVLDNGRIEVRRPGYRPPAWSGPLPAFAAIDSAEAWLPPAFLAGAHTLYIRYRGYGLRGGQHVWAAKDSPALRIPLADDGLAELRAGWCTLRSLHSGRHLDVYGARKGDGEGLVQWQAHGMDHQALRLLPAGRAGEYRIVMKHSGKCLDAKLAGGVWRVVQNAEAPVRTQYWKFVFRGGALLLLNAANGLALAPEGGRLDNGAPLVLEPASGAPGQLWTPWKR